MSKHNKKNKRNDSQDRTPNGSLATGGEEDLAESSPVVDTSAWGPCPVCGEWLALHDPGAEDDLGTCIELLKDLLAAARQFQQPYQPLPYYPQPNCPPLPQNPWPPSYPTYPQTWCGGTDGHLIPGS
jgi:hypothetical protein